jgi:hypothetical protein
MSDHCVGPRFTIRGGVSCTFTVHSLADESAKLVKWPPTIHDGEARKPKSWFQPP